jgi:hypothetical protein
MSQINYGIKNRQSINDPIKIDPRFLLNILLDGKNTLVLFFVMYHYEVLPLMQ